MERYDEISGYEKLGNAVVKRAADDYTEALCKGWKDTIMECERFFKGPLFHLYTKVDGEWLMCELRRRAEEYNYDFEAIERDKRRWSRIENE